MRGDDDHIMGTVEAGIDNDVATFTTVVATSDLQIWK